MGKDKPGWLFKGQQSLLIFQNQIVGRNVIGHIRATLNRTVDAVPFLINAEIALMHIMYIGGIQIGSILRLKNRTIFVHYSHVFLLKNLAILAQKLIAVFIVLTVFSHFVNEEQGKGLDTHFEQLLFFFKVGNDRLPNLHPAHIILRDIAGYITFADGIAIGKCHNASDRVNFRNDKALILLHLAGDIVEIITHIQCTEFPLCAALVFDLQLHLCPWRILGGDNDAFQIQIFVCTTQVLDLKALDLDLLDQPLIVSIQRIQRVNQVVLLGVGSGVVQREQGIEFLQRFLGSRILFTHLLRFIQNQNRAVGCDDVNRAAGTELVPLGVNNSRSGITLATFHVLVLVHGGSKGLCIDNHDVDAGIAGE